MHAQSLGDRADEVEPSTKLKHLEPTFITSSPSTGTVSPPITLTTASSIESPWNVHCMFRGQ